MDDRVTISRAARSRTILGAHFGGHFGALPGALLLGCVLATVLLVAAGCRHKPPPEPPPVPPGGPTIEIRLRVAERVSLVLPPRVRVVRLPLREVILDGAVGRGADGRVEVRIEDRRIAFGTLRAEGPVEIAPLADPDDIERASAGRGAGPREGPFLGLAPDASVLAAASTKDALAPRFYRGQFVLRRVGQMVELSSSLSLEEYLASVVGGEMVASTTPLEGLKAQAVAARTYALYAMREAQDAGREASFASDQSFQVYGGRALEHPRVAEAVLATAGEVLTWKGSLFRAYFHSTCGGQTADARTFFGEPDIPPLRGVPCGACDGSRFFRWEASWTAAELLEALGPWLVARGVRAEPIEDLRVSEIFPDGRVRYVKLEHGGGSVEIQASRLRVLLGGGSGGGGGREAGVLRSTAFDVRRVGGSFVFQGAGWGHGIGLCQVGAGRLGGAQGYREILAKYYPESDVTPAY